MASHPEWDMHTTGTEVAQAFNKEISGKTVLITGVSPAGIGATTALAIAAQGPGKLILASRTASKLDGVVSDIKKMFPAVAVEAVVLDLSSVDSVRAAADKIRSVTDSIDVLINNAGVSHTARDPIVAPDGTALDKQLFVNHLGPFLFTTLLLPLLQTASSRPGSTRGATRVINLSSHGHRLSPIRFSDYAFEKPLFDESLPEEELPSKKAPEFLLRQMGEGEDKFPGFVAYGQSKCANVLHATELSRRFWREHGILAFSVHPGSIKTELSRTLDEVGKHDMLKTAPRHLWKTQDAGASTTLVAAFDPALSRVDVGGEAVGYLADCQLRDDLAVAHAKDKSAARRLWEESEKMLGISSGSKS